MARKLAIVLATWFGAGYSPVAPGTAGSLAAVIIAWLLHRYAGAGAWTFGLMALAAFLPAVWAAGETAIAVGKEDPGLVVVDEVVGQWLTLAGAAAFNWKSWLLAFALFRIFDIWKPAPVRQLERLPGGWGIIADDGMAGIYGALVMAGAGWFNLY
jgi:phosphatidylglycerophosphatase A